MPSLAKTRISAVLPPRLSVELKRAATLKNVPQSRILEEALKLWLEQRLNEETKELSKLRFDDLPTEEDWLAIQTKI